MALTKKEQEELELLELEEQEAAHLSKQKQQKAVEPEKTGIDYLREAILSNPQVALASSALNKGKEIYSDLQDPEKRQMLIKSGVENLPTAGAMIGGAVGTPADVVSGPLGTVAGAALGGAAGKSLQNAIEPYLVDDYKPKTTQELFTEPVKAAGESALYEMGGQAVAKAIPMVMDSASSGLRKLAENFAKKATGATGKQSEKFAEDAGAKLLDLGVVKFGDTASDIAERSGKMMDEASQGMQKALNDPRLSNVVLDENQIIKPLEDKIAQMSQRGSQVQSAQKLQKVVDDIKSAQALRGSSALSPVEAEAEKRSWNKSSLNWLADNKEELKDAYRAYRKAVEDSMSSASPELAQKFIQDKQLYGLLNPIEEAASKRAAQLNQSPFGSLLDMASAAASGGGPLGIVTAASRRAISPALPSSLAVGANTASKAIKSVGSVVNPLLETSQGLGQLFNIQQPQVEQPTDRAERINQERKFLKGK